MSMSLTTVPAHSQDLIETAFPRIIKLLLEDLSNGDVTLCLASLHALCKLAGDGKTNQL